MKHTRIAAVNITFLLIPVVISLIVAALLVNAVGRDPLEVVDALWKGAFKDSRKVGSVVNFWIPLTLVSIGLVVTFRAGLWNIGVEGQMMMGAIFASWGAQFIPLGESLAPLLHLALLLLAALGGMFWAFVVGALKIRLGVNEIFGGVALNALVNVISIYMIFRTLATTHRRLGTRHRTLSQSRAAARIFQRLSRQHLHDSFGIRLLRHGPCLTQRHTLGD